MTVVSTTEWPAAGRPFTVGELDRMPDDGRRYELLDGALIVSPRPTTIHQMVAGRLLVLLSTACADGLSYARAGRPVERPDGIRSGHRRGAQ